MLRTQTVDQCVSDAYLKATGKGGGLTFGTTKYIKLLALLNYHTQQWALNMGVQWRSLRSIFTVSGTVTATDTFTIPATVGEISQQEGDFVRIAHSDGIKESQYTLVDIEELYGYGPKILAAGELRTDTVGVCAVSGNSLIFGRAFLSTDAQFGGTITIPGYSIPPALTLSTDVVQVNDPSWLAVRAAADFALTDITRSQYYDPLIAEAREKMEQMKRHNKSQVKTVNSGMWRPPGQTW